MRWGRTLLVFALGSLLCSGAFATFRVANLVVVPTAASTPGLYGSNWHTDLEIMNVDSAAVDVQLVLLKCCGVDNVVWFEDTTLITGVTGRREGSPIPATLMRVFTINV